MKIYQMKKRRRSNSVRDITTEIMGTVFSYYFERIDVAEDAKDDLNEAFEKLPKSGFLKKKVTGFTYIDVDDKYIREGVKVIKKYGFEKAPYFGEGFDGAHISVMDEEEGKKVDAQDILEKEVYFNIESFMLVKPKATWAEKELFLAIVKADILDQIREDKGLEKIRHPFHITIGTRDR